MSTDSELMEKQIQSRLDRLHRLGWQTFKGEDVLEQFRKFLRYPLKPILIVHCERKPGWGQHDYEHFIPICLNTNPSTKLVVISGTIGPNGPLVYLNWHPAKTFDESGTFVSYISTLQR